MIHRVTEFYETHLSRGCAVPDESLRTGSFFVFGVGSTPAFSQAEEEVQLRLCAGMVIEQRLPSGVWADCVSDTHAIEIAWTEEWAEAVG